MDTPTFTLGPNDRVDHDRREVYTSGSVAGVPPVCTAWWDRAAWSRWDARVAHCRQLAEECSAVGYRLVCL